MVIRIETHVVVGDDDLSLCGLPDADLNREPVKIGGVEEDRVACIACLRLLIERYEKLNTSFNEWQDMLEKAFRNWGSLPDEDEETQSTEDEGENGGPDR